MGTVNTTLGRLAYFDTNIFIHVLEGFPESERVLRKVLAAMDAGELAVATSELTVAEVLVKPKRERNHALEAAYLRILQPSPTMRIIPITLDILLRAAEIRASTALKLPDAIHLATAQAEGCESFLTSDRSFHGDKGVRITLLDQLILE